MSKLRRVQRPSVARRAKSAPCCRRARARKSAAKLREKCPTNVTDVALALTMSAYVLIECYETRAFKASLLPGYYACAILALFMILTEKPMRL